jgi:hypothetical protein
MSLKTTDKGLRFNRIDIIDLAVMLNRVMSRLNKLFLTMKKDYSLLTKYNA